MSIYNSMIAWIDKRFPLTSNWKAHLSEYYAPKKFQFLVLLWFISSSSSGKSNNNRYFSDDELQA